MKKLIALLSLVLLMSVSFADENGIKQTIVQVNQLMMDGKIADIQKYYTKDYSSVSRNNNKMTSKDLQDLVLLLDGKHPELFMTFLFKAQAKRDPSPEEKKELKTAAQSDQIKLIYPVFCEKMMSVMKNTAKLEHDSLKIIKIEVNGTQATAVYEYETLDANDLILSKKIKVTSTSKFRKENGIWKFAESQQK